MGRSGTEHGWVAGGGQRGSGSRRAWAAEMGGGIGGSSRARVGRMVGNHQLCPSQHCLKSNLEFKSIYSVTVTASHSHEAPTVNVNETFALNRRLTQASNHER